MRPKSVAATVVVAVIVAAAVVVGREQTAATAATLVATTAKTERSACKDKDKDDDEYPVARVVTVTHKNVPPLNYFGIHHILCSKRTKSDKICRFYKIFV